MNGNGPTRLAIGVLAVTALAFGLAHANRLPGSAGELLRANIETNRDATALFFTEVDGWDEWTTQRHMPVDINEATLEPCHAGLKASPPGWLRTAEAVRHDDRAATREPCATTGPVRTTGTLPVSWRRPSGLRGTAKP